MMLSLPNVAPETLRWAETMMWIRELKIAQAKRDRRATFIAAEKVCEAFGVADALRAVWSDGFLRLPPKWPAVDVVPFGGGPGLVTFAVRSMMAGVRREVKIGMKQGKPGTHAEAIEEGIKRGKFELARLYG